MIRALIREMYNMKTLKFGTRVFGTVFERFKLNLFGTILVCLKLGSKFKAPFRRVFSADLELIMSSNLKRRRLK